MAIKLRIEPGLSVAAMDIQSQDDFAIRRQRFLKMSVGENPKARCYPSTRPSEAAVFREYYSKASLLRDEQDIWCGGRFQGAFPEDAVLQPLVDVLRGHMQVHVHGYKTEDLEVRRVKITVANTLAVIRR